MLSYRKNENICERPPLRHTAASSITSFGIVDEDSSLLPACTAVVRDCVYEFCTIHTELCQNACSSALLQLGSLHMNGVVLSAVGMRCVCTCPVVIYNGMYLNTISHDTINSHVETLPYRTRFQVSELE